MTEKLPKPVEDFKNEYKEVWENFVRLGDSCHDAGPLDEKTRRLVKLALAVGAGLEGAVHSAVRNARERGVTPEELRQVAVLGITTLGFPATMRALTWIYDCIAADSKKT